MPTDRVYVIGETPTLRAQVRDPQTRQPVDPDSVEVVEFSIGGLDVALAEVIFIRVDEGAFELPLPTAHLDPGVYSMRFKIEGDLGVTYLDDTLVLTE